MSIKKLKTRSLEHSPIEFLAQLGKRDTVILKN